MHAAAYPPCHLASIPRYSSCSSLPPRPPSSQPQLGDARAVVPGRGGQRGCAAAPGGGAVAGPALASRPGLAAGPRRRAVKLQAKGSAELISLGLDTPPSTRSSPRGSGAGPGLPSLVYPGSLSSRSASPLPSGRSAGWLSTRAASQQAADGGEAAAAAAVGEASLAGSPSWAAQVAAPVAAADGGGSGPPGVPRESSYSSNLNRLGRSGHFSRRSASALASPEPLD